IAAQPTVRQRWGTTLETRGLLTPGRADEMLDARMGRLQQMLDALDPEEHLVESTPVIAAAGTAAQTKTAVPLDRLRTLNDGLLTVPDGFTVHRKLERARERRRQALAQPDERTVDWSA